MNEKQKKAFNIYRNVGLGFAFILTEMPDLKTLKILQKKAEDSKYEGGFFEFFVNEIVNKKKKPKDLEKLEADFRKEVTQALKKMITESQKLTKKELEEVNKMFDAKTCDELLKIVEKYKLSLPPLTEELKAEQLQEYVLEALKNNSDPKSNFGKMWSEIQNTKVFKDAITVNVDVTFKAEPVTKQSGPTMLKCPNCGSVMERGELHSKDSDGICTVQNSDGSSYKFHRDPVR